ncbi:hypothetical protein GTY41_14155, partial [Streptomyces sp. SID685]|uniref:hypothetical protein n=1 Tax=Streptomyces sp. SID685 TaxID=2690322 RepID=UPI00136D1408
MSHSHNAIPRAGAHARSAPTVRHSEPRGGIDLHAEFRDGEGKVGLVQVRGKQFLELPDEAGHEVAVGGV